MRAFICSTCGTQYSPSEAPPGVCLICTDERQFIPASGQSWTTLEWIRKAYSNKYRRLATGLTTIETTPAFGIAQRAILARTPSDNVLWDCIALIDDATVDLLTGLGGVAAIAISHPHYYTTMVEWSHAFGGVLSVATLFDVAAGKHFDGFPLPLPELCRGVWEAEVGSSGELVAFGGFDDAACGCHGGEAFVEGGGSHPTNGAQIGEWLRLGGVGEGCDDAVVDGARLGG